MSNKSWRIYITFAVLVAGVYQYETVKKHEFITITVDSTDLYLSSEEMENAMLKAKRLAKSKCSSFVELNPMEVHIQAYVPTRISYE